ncbi:MAG: permease [Bacteroidales bacterium]
MEGESVMMEFIRRYGAELAGLVNEMSPYLMLGFFFAGLLRVVFPRHVITRYMGRRNLRSAMNASLLGVPMPLCSCGVLPTGIGFYKNGASRGSTVSFLISTPQTGIDSMLATYSLLGLPLAIIRPVVALVTGVFGGVLGNLVDRNGRGKEEVDIQEEEYPRDMKEMFRYGFVELVQDISKWLVIGMLLAALLSVVIPDDFFTQNISSEYLAMLLMLLASVPLYICATGSIPIAAVLLMKGLSPGAALVLLMAGPATNIATMAVIGNALGRKTLWVYLASIVGGALLFGILINELIPREWIMGAIPAGTHGAVHEHGTGWFKWAMTAMLFLLIVNGYLQRWLTRRREHKKNMMKMQYMKSNIHVFKVEGMTCSHCKATVERGLSGISQVTEVVADPGRNTVTVEAGALNDEQVRATVEELGYIYQGRI